MNFRDWKERERCIGISVRNRLKKYIQEYFKKSFDFYFEEECRN